MSNAYNFIILPKNVYNFKFIQYFYILQKIVENVRKKLYTELICFCVLLTRH